MRRPLFALLVAWCVGAAAAAKAADREIVVSVIPPVFAAPRVPDRELAAMRGGIALPNGFDIAIGIDIQTRVDGVLVLHTIFSSDGPIVGTRVFTDGTDGVRLAPGTTVLTKPASPGTPIIVPDRSPTGTTIVVTPGTAGATVNFVNGPQSTWVTAEGQNEVPVTANGPMVAQGPGSFGETSDASGTIVTLDTGDLQIRHLVGQATGAVVANTANDRAIDTIASINVSAANLAPLLTASQFTSDALALQIARVQ